jgi:hypothetical protein
MKEDIPKIALFLTISYVIFISLIEYIFDL